MRGETELHILELVRVPEAKPTSAAHGKDGLHMFYFKAKELEAKSDH